MTEDYIIEIKGSGKTPYKVNLQTYACTCPDWRNTRAQQAMDSPRRLCKHLIKAICENGLEGEFPDADLQALYKKKKGYPVPKSDLHSLAAIYFDGILTEEDHSRIRFLFGETSSYTNFSEFKDLTKEGNTICYAPENKPIRIACKRLVWARLAETGTNSEYIDLIPALEIKDMKRVGEVLNEKFAQKRKGIAVLGTYADMLLGHAFNKAEIRKENFFILKPLDIDMLR